jgi:hypothetical protein
MIRLTVGRISFQEWADILGSIEVKYLMSKRPGSTQISPVQDAAYMAIGDAVYKMVPVASTGKLKALSGIRERLRQEAKDEGIFIRRAAKDAASGLISEAKDKLDTAKGVLEEAKRKLAAPDWIQELGLPYFFKPSKEMWCVRTVIEVRLRGFDFAGSYKGKDYAFSVRGTGLGVPRRYGVWFCVSKDGTFSPTSCFMDELGRVLPHISYRSSCMGVSDAPPKITSAEEFKRAVRGVERTCQYVQMNSLFCGSEQWAKDFEKDIPPDLYKFLVKGDWQGYFITRAKEEQAKKDELAALAAALTPAPATAPTEEVSSIPTAVTMGTINLVPTNGTATQGVVAGGFAGTAANAVAEPNNLLEVILNENQRDAVLGVETEQEGDTEVWTA